jgi:DNA-directed RNA polymerase alpha subunit
VVPILGERRVSSMTSDRKRGIARLGQLHGLPRRTVLRTRNAGSHALEELKTVLRRAEAGEFGLPEE